MTRLSSVATSSLYVVPHDRETIKKDANKRINKGTANTLAFINDGAFYSGVAYTITIYELALVAPHCKIQ